MRPKAQALLVTVAFVVIIIKAGLTDRNHTGVLCTLYQFGGVDIGMAIGFMRMDTDGRPNIRLALGHADNGVPFGCTRRYVQHFGNPRTASAREDFSLLFHDAFVDKMTM
jgi:hypothetical protein